ncbi:MAG TPA: phosphotransferase family protein, partial [Acidimicrobiia bacterium]|nr:phosphotransferase family protein [Acidimicrobiia bacterium]
MTTDLRPGPTGPAAGLPGLDLPALAAWCDGPGRPSGLVPPLQATLVKGGKSNLTYRIDDAGGRSFALRRPPLGKLLPKAHDVVREHRLICALHTRSDVPVPRPVAACSDPDVIGAPFFLMDFVDGRVLRTRRSCADVPDAVRRAAGLGIVDTLVALHAVTPEALGLADLAPHDGYIRRQVTRWQGQFDRSRIRDVPDVDAVGRWLAEHAPPQTETRLVHGDFRLDNAIVDGEGRGLAVLDWEIATLGDPLADLAILLAYWGGEGEAAIGATDLPGFPDRAAVIDRYAAASGRDLAALAYHRVFAYWKLACV